MAVLRRLLKEGLSAGIAMVAVARLMLWHRNEFLALVYGIAIVAGMRAMG